MNEERTVTVEFSLSDRIGGVTRFRVDVDIVAETIEHNEFGSIDIQAKDARIQMRKEVYQEISPDALSRSNW